MDKIKNRQNSGESGHGKRVNNLRFAEDIWYYWTEQWEIAGYSRQITCRKWTMWNAYTTKCSEGKARKKWWKKLEENDAKVNIDGQATQRFV